jgi:hypothetical protein
MADDNVFDIGIGTSADLDTLNKALKDIESGLNKSGKQQTDATNKTEKDKTKIVENESKKRKATFDKEGKASLDSIKGFARGAVGQIAGIDQVLGAVAGGPVAIGAAFAKMGKQAIDTLNQWADASIEVAKTQDSLRAVIESTGARAWTTAGQLNQLARAQSDATGRSIDEISRAQTALLGYTNITKDLFADTTQAALNMAQVTGTDMKSAVETLGKALDVPSQGLTALSRQGFRFNEQQKEMVKDLENSGRLIEAQRVILDQVTTTYDKAATAVNPAVQAQIALNNALSEYKILHGQDWERITRGFKIALATYIKSMNDAKRATNELKNAIGILEKDSGVSLETLQAQVQATKARITLASTNLERQTAPIWKKLLVFNETLLRDTDSWTTMYQDYIKESTNYLNTLEQQTSLLGDVENIIERTDKIMQSDGSLESVNNHNEALQLKEELLRELESLNSNVNITENMSYGERIEQLKNTIGLNDELAASIRERIDALSRILTIEETEAKKQENVSNFREKYAEALRKTNAEILKDAYLRNEISEQEYQKLLLINNTSKDTGALFKEQITSTSLQNKLLDTQISAYKGLLESSNGLLDGTLRYEQAIENVIKTEVEQARLNKLSDEERKKRLADLAKTQEEVQSRLSKILEDARAEGEKLLDTRQQQAYEDELLAIRKKSVVDAVNFEAEHRRQLVEINRQDALTEFDNNYNLAVEQLKRRRELELEMLAEGSRERLDAEGKFQEEETSLAERNLYDRNQLEIQLKRNADEEKRQIDRETAKNMEDAYKEAYQNMNALAQEFMNAANSIANSISAIWTNNIDYQTNEKLKANDALVQSDEERAAKEKKIMIEAAYERYKAELFAWTASVNMAMAQTAMSMLTAYQKGMEGGFGLSAPATAALFMGLAAVIGGMNVAAVISARPQRPRFHTGGVVGGRSGQEVPAVLMSGETVTTGKQFSNIMQAFQNMANMKSGSGGSPEMKVTVNNNAANVVSTSQSMDADGLKIIIEQITGDALSNGRLDNSLALQRAHSGGAIIGN